MVMQVGSLILRNLAEPTVDRSLVGKSTSQTLLHRSIGTQPQVTRRHTTQATRQPSHYSRNPLLRRIRCSPTRAIAKTQRRPQFVDFQDLGHVQNLLTQNDTVSATLIWKRTTTLINLHVRLPSRSN